MASWLGSPTIRSTAAWNLRNSGGVCGGVGGKVGGWVGVKVEGC